MKITRGCRYEGYSKACIYIEHGLESKLQIYFRNYVGLNIAFQGIIFEIYLVQSRSKSLNFFLSSLFYCKFQGIIRSIKKNVLEFLIFSKGIKHIYLLYLLLAQCTLPF